MCTQATVGSQKVYLKQSGGYMKVTCTRKVLSCASKCDQKSENMKKLF